MIVYCFVFLRCETLSNVYVYCLLRPRDNKYYGTDTLLFQYSYFYVYSYSYLWKYLRWFCSEMKLTNVSRRRHGVAHISTDNKQQANQSHDNQVGCKRHAIFFFFYHAGEFAFYASREISANFARNAEIRLTNKNKNQKKNEMKYARQQENDTVLLSGRLGRNITCYARQGASRGRADKKIKQKVATMKWKSYF